MKKIKGQPITGTNTAMRSKPPVLSDAADTSRDTQKQILQPPQPFANAKGAGQLPSGTGPAGAVPGLEPKIKAGLSGNRAPKLPPGAAIGQRTMPNQSKQIGGRMGYPPPPRKAGNNTSRFPQKRNASFYGE